MKFDSNRLTSIIASSLLSSTFVSPVIANDITRTLSWNAPSSRENGDSLNPLQEIDFYMIYRNVDNNGWAFYRAVQQEDNSAGDGYNFSIPVTIPEGSSVMYGASAVDTNGLKSKISYASASNSDQDTDSPTSPPNTLEDYLFDLSKNPVSTYGNFEKDITSSGVEIDSYYTLGSMGCHYELPMEKSLSLQDYSSLKYEVESKTETDIVFSVLSGEFWYSKRVSLDKGVNQGMISLNSFSRSFTQQDSTANTSIPIYSGEPVYLSDLGVEGASLSISGASISCGSSQIELQKMGVYK